MQSHPTSKAAEASIHVTAIANERLAINKQMLLPSELAQQHNMLGEIDGRFDDTAIAGGEKYGDDHEDGDAIAPDDDDSAQAKDEEEDDEAAIDQLFADLETAVKYLGLGLHKALQPPSRPLFAVPVAIRGAVAVVLAILVTVAVVMPTFFAVLAVRMVKVEVTKENFVKRAAMIAAETVAQHTARLGRLLLRATPLITLLVVLPPVVVLAVIPSLSRAEQSKCALAFTTIFCFLVTTMQVQGTVRAGVTFAASGEARAKTRAAAAAVVQKWWRRRWGCRSASDRAVARATDAGEIPRAPPRDAAGPAYHPQVHFATLSWSRSQDPLRPDGHLDTMELPDVRLPGLYRLPEPGPWHRNLAVFVALGLEAMQLALFSFQFLLIAPDSPFRLGDVPWLDPYVPYVFFSFPDPNLVRPWVAFGAVALVVLIIASRMLVEIVAYHRGADDEATRGEAEAEFFHSFVGSVLYGHGNPKSVPAALCTSVQLLCDTLFFTVVGSLGSSMGCFDAAETVLYRSDVACFSATHLKALTASLAAFGFFVPLSILVAPVLAEANKPPGGQCISIVKPFTMASNAAKCVAILVTILASLRVWPGAASGLGLSVFLTGLSGGWAGAKKFLEPSTSRRLNVTRVLTSACGVVCAVVSLSVAGASGAWGGLVYILLAASVVLFDVVGPVAVRLVVAAEASLPA